MKKIILFVIFVIVLVSIVYYVTLSPTEKYSWKVTFMNESQLRNEIKNSYYIESSYESCDLNNSRWFDSKENCLRTMECGSTKLSLAIPSDDLKDLVRVMNKGENAESAIINYFSVNPDIKNQLEKERQDCLYGYIN